MSLLSPTALATLRAVARATMTDTCTIQQSSVTADSIGQPVKSWSPLTTGVACRLRLRSGQEQVAGERLAGVSSWELWLPHDQAISREMRVVVGARTFEVVAENTGETERVKTLADLVEVT